MLIIPLAPATLSVMTYGTTVYAIIKSIDYMYHTAMNKEKPITVIKFEEWKRVAQ